MKAVQSPYLTPLILAVYPILFIYAVNSGSTLFFPVIWPVMISLTVTLFLIRQFKDKLKGGLMVSLGLVLFFSYGHIHSMMHQMLVEWGVSYEVLNETLSLRIVLHTVLYLYFAALAMAAVRRIRLSDRKKLLIVMKVVNVIASMLILQLVATTVSKASSPIHASAIPNLEQSTLHPNSELINKLGYRPDIYYIILDGYGRKDVLEKYYGFDNKQFYAFLNSHDFFIAQQSRTNYFSTFLSLASSLNMSYINFLAEGHGQHSQDNQQAFELARNSLVSRQLKEIGYRFIHFKSTIEPTNINPYADMLIAGTEGIFQDEFYRVLFNSTMLRILRPLISEDLAQYHLGTLNKLTTIGAMPGPKFVFAHILPPHHPYLFDRDGNVRRHATMLNQMQWQKKLWHDKQSYVDQLIFVNSKIEEVIEGIFERSENPPIIIIQSDHGPQLLNTELKEHNDYQHARTGNLLAIYAPGVETDFLPSDVTPVNLFRMLLNKYFSSDYQVLPNRFYYSSYRFPYAFTEIKPQSRPAK